LDWQFGYLASYALVFDPSGPNAFIGGVNSISNATSPEELSGYSTSYSVIAGAAVQGGGGIANLSDAGGWGNLTGGTPYIINTYGGVGFSPDPTGTLSASGGGAYGPAVGQSASVRSVMEVGKAAFRSSIGMYYYYFTAEDN
jgi:hypothetical protein